MGARLLQQLLSVGAHGGAGRAPDDPHSSVAFCGLAGFAGWRDSAYESGELPDRVRRAQRRPAVQPTKLAGRVGTQRVVLHHCDKTRQTNLSAPVSVGCGHDSLDSRARGQHAQFSEQAISDLLIDL